ncbi:MAG: carboxypeptidase-like regulatory domain-containing protein, partial [Patescibacteria group bacterium]|nr:carboxypeptidase-like regulatory domain-containing protein [Patescibacteria group bacterium]
VAELTTSSSKTEEEKTIEKQGGIAAFLILGNMPKEASVGQPFGNKVKVTVADVGGSIVKGYAKAVYFTSSDALAQLSYNEAHPYTFTAADAGVHEFASTDFVLNTGGRQQLTISDNSVKSTVEIKVNSTVATVLQQSAIYVEGFFNNPEQISHINLAVAVLIASALLMPVLINGFSNLNNLWPLILYWFTYLSQILGLRRRRKTWGIVFNSQTGQPVPFALVKLLDKSGRLIELSISDNQGRYGLTPKHGIFTLKVSRADFVFPSESKTSIFYEKIYTDSEIKIVDANQSVAFNIPLDPHSRSTIILVLLSWLVKFNHLIQKVRLPLFVLGAIFSLTMVVINFIFLYVVFLAYCVFMIIFDVIRLSRATAAGTVSDVYSHPISGAIVRIYHKQDNHLVETDISNKHGRFKFKVQPGVYYLVATKPNYIDTKTHLMYLEKGQKKEAISSISIKLKKE